jgi:hypothetical protein
MSDGRTSEFDMGSLPRELALVWALYLLDAVAMLVTYSRVPATELYHVSGAGLQGGSSRVLVFSNFSAALAAIAILLVLADRFPHTAPRLAAVAGVILCAPVFWPGVVDQADLDARPINAVASLGVLVGLALTVSLALRTRRVAWSGAAHGDRVRLAVGAVAAFVALPWIAAELGLFLDGVPVLGRLFQTGPYHPSSAQSTTVVAVHHGHHHGMDGLLLLTTALLLSRLVPTVRASGLRVLLGAYLALMAAYAIGNIANDFWTEQVWKRDWTAWQIPDVLEPKASVAWGLIVLGAATLYAGATWSSRRPGGRGRSDLAALVAD